MKLAFNVLTFCILVLGAAVSLVCDNIPAFFYALTGLIVTAELIVLKVRND